MRQYLECQMLWQKRHINLRWTILDEVVGRLARTRSKAIDGAEEIAQPGQELLLRWFVRPADALRSGITEAHEYKAGEACSRAKGMGDGPPYWGLL
jgi:hypothetical protein